jgi:hypothetical protein
VDEKILSKGQVDLSEKKKTPQGKIPLTGKDYLQKRGKTSLH